MKRIMMVFCITGLILVSYSYSQSWATVDNMADPNELLADLSTFIATDLCIGPIVISLETGNVEIPGGTSLNDASKEFWKYVEKHFRRDAKLALRLELLQEVEIEARYP